MKPLSQVEVECLQYAADGYTVHETGRATFRSPKTIKVHRSNAYTKLGVDNITEAVVKAYLLGLITLGGHRFAPQQELQFAS
jgi:DNA-binding CsgD family transcriptional regulator